MRNILILAPAFFPDPQVSGIRVTQWARHLPEFGWAPLVLTRDQGHSATPEMLAESLHPAVRVQYLGPRLSSSTPSGPARAGKASPVRATAMKLLDLVSVPDVLVWKWKALSEQAIEIARQSRPDVVLSSSPSHSIHVAGRRIAQAIGVPWVADFRDPYMIDYRFKPHGLQRLVAPWHRRFERSIYRDAALCVHAIPIHARWVSRRYPSARHKIRILTNGIPSALLDGDFLRTAANARDPASGRISIRTIGVVPRSAVESIARAIRLLLDEGIDVEFRQVGYARDAAGAVPDDMQDRILLLGPMRHDLALREAAGADILLNYLDEERAKVSGLSSKLFEYLAVGKPIVAVNPTRPDRQLIGRLPWCTCLTDPSPSAIAAVLREAIVNRPCPSADWQAAFREKYNRRTQTQQLAKWLDELVPPRPNSAANPTLRAAST